MSSLSSKDRVSLCSFTFSDGRRCRTPRNRNHPHFCFYHAQKEARAGAAQNLGKDLAYFFSGDYLSACDLSTALARLIPAVVRGDVKPRAARTVAYLAQTLLQAIHISEDEYINAFGTDGWRRSIRNSVKYNHDYRFPPAAEPQPQPAQPQTQVPQPASTLPSNPPQPAAITSPTPSPKATPPEPAEMSASCHSERSEEPASSFSSASPTPPASQPPTISPQASSPANPSAVPKPQPTSSLPHTPVPHQPTPQVSHPNTPSPTVRPSQQRLPSTPNRDPYAVHFDHNCRLFIDGKPF